MVAGVVSVIILGIGWMAASDKKISRNVIAGLSVVLGVAILGGGVWATVDGEREFHEHVPHGEEHGDDGHSDDDHSDDDHGDEHGDDEHGEDEE